MSAPAREVVLFGSSGHARSIADALCRLGWSIRAIVAPGGIDGFSAAEHLARDDEGATLSREGRFAAVVAIGDNRRRLALVRELHAAGVDVPGVVAATATVAPDARLGAGSVVLEHAHVGPQAQVGEAAIVNTAGVVEHDATVGDGGHCAPGAVLGGGAGCGEGTLVGAGAVLLPGVCLGDWASLGAGAVLQANAPGGATYVGVPARALRPQGPRSA